MGLPVHPVLEERKRKAATVAHLPWIPVTILTTHVHNLDVLWLAVWNEDNPPLGSIILVKPQKKNMTEE